MSSVFYFNFNALEKIIADDERIHIILAKYNQNNEEE